MPFSIVNQDITSLQVDAIVNAANTGLAMGGGVCGAIFRAAGPDRLQAACRPLAPIRTGQAVITPGFDLPAKYVIHTAGPVYDPSAPKECEEALRSSYLESMKLAMAHNCESIAFPLISSGIYGYPRGEALRVAITAIQDFLADRDLEVTLILLDKEVVLESLDRYEEIESYLQENFDRTAFLDRSLLRIEEDRVLAESVTDSDRASHPAHKEKSLSPLADGGLARAIDQLDEPFSRLLLAMIDSKGMTDVEVYKRANLDRKHFSKIRCKEGYVPGKRTILALAVAMKLSLEETDALLERAGYALSRAEKFDVIVEYFLIHKIYDIFTINQIQFAYDQPLLGSF